MSAAQRSVRFECPECSAAWSRVVLVFKPTHRLPAAVYWENTDTLPLEDLLGKSRRKRQLALDSLATCRDSCKRCFLASTRLDWISFNPQKFHKVRVQSNFAKGVTRKTNVSRKYTKYKIIKSTYLANSYYEVWWNKLQFISVSYRANLRNYKIKEF